MAHMPSHPGLSKEYFQAGRSPVLARISRVRPLKQIMLRNALYSPPPRMSPKNGESGPIPHPCFFWPQFGCRGRTRVGSKAQRRASKF